MSGCAMAREVKSLRRRSGRWCNTPLKSRRSLLAAQICCRGCERVVQCEVEDVREVQKLPQGESESQDLQLARARQKCCSLRRAYSSDGSEVHVQGRGR